PAAASPSAERPAVRPIATGPGRLAGGASASDSPSAAGAASGALPSPDGAAPALISASGWPTLTTLSDSTSSLLIVPLAGAGTSASTLSVETSTTVCPSST